MPNMAQYGYMEGFPTPDAPFSLDTARKLQSDVFEQAMRLLPPKDVESRDRAYKLILESAGGLAAIAKQKGN